MYVPALGGDHPLKSLSSQSDIEQFGDVGCALREKLPFA